MLSIIDLRVAFVAVSCLAASVGLGALTLWFWRNSRLESPVLAPLEVMSERRFKKVPEDQRHQLLDEVRGLVRVPRGGDRPTARRRAPQPREEVWDGPLDDEPVEQFVGDVRTPATVIDPLLGRRGN